ncbi:MAG TPA: DEAD/DEAH box helicase [Tepidisphaeraceae bacterium]|jgi:superfamily II DNA or RNA helicase|nr:DEAD/DEAH box helicase [Tepidisphaeraceae bacterium]
MMEDEKKSGMTLTGSFSGAVKSRGRDYFRSGAVHRLRREGDIVRAVVAGSTSYDVTLHLKDGKAVQAECSCPFFADRGKPCKHQWAVLLAARRQWPEMREAEEVQAPVQQQQEQQQQEESGERTEMKVEETAGNRAGDGPAQQRGEREFREREQGNGHGGMMQRENGEQWERQIDQLILRSRPVIDGGGSQRDRHRHRHQHHQKKHATDGELIFVIDPNPKRHLAGGLEVRVGARWRKPNGGSHLRLYRAENIRPSEWMDFRDRITIGQLIGSASSLGQQQHREGFMIAPEMWTTALPVLCSSGKVYMWSPAEKFPREPLVWDETDGAWKFAAIMERMENGDLRLRGELRRGEERLSMSDPRLILTAGLVFTKNRICPLDAGGATAWVAFLRGGGQVVVPAGQVERFVSRLVGIARSTQFLELPEDLRVERMEIAPRPRAIFRPAEQIDGYGHLTRIEVAYNYNGTLIGPGPAPARVLDVEKRRIVVRQPDREQAAILRLRDIGLREVDEYRKSGEPPRFACLAVQAMGYARQLMAEGWEVEVEGKQFRTGGRVEVDVKSGIDWFDVTGSLDFGGAAVGLPELLAAVRRGDDTIVLDDGSVGLLTDDMKKKFRWMGVGETRGGAVRFGRQQAGVLDALLGQVPEARVDEVFSKVREELRAFEGIEEVKPPKTFKGELRPYQQLALGWFGFLRRFGFGGILADDMGLGKTVQVLALLEMRRAEKSKKGSKVEAPKPSLVVVPRSLVFNWVNEAEKFAPKLKVLDFSTADRGDETEHLNDYDLVISTYGTVRTDIERLKDFKFDYVILDEAHAIKNAQSQSAKTVKLLYGEHRLALTGTPVQNHLGDLWSQMEFLNPGMLSSSSVFASAGGRTVDESGQAVLGQALKPFILRRTKEQVAPELPERSEQTLYCTLEGEERKAYDDLREHYRKVLLKKIDTAGLGKSKMQVLEALLRLRQAAIHPGLLNKDMSNEPSAKLETLLSRLEEVTENHKAIVFSQFTTMLGIVRERLDKAGIPYEYLDGKTKDREAVVEHFKTDEKCRIFLISLKAGGVGLNLTEAEYVFLLDPWWNPAIEAQAIDRTHRIGQTKNVYACRLIARDTVEEKVLDLQQNKKKLAEAIISGEESMLKSLKKEDLELLLS